jgi:hypothetical protein
MTARLVVREGTAAREVLAARSLATAVLGVWVAQAALAAQEATVSRVPTGFSRVRPVKMAATGLVVTF